MLVLSRKIGEKIVIGEGIVVTVLEVKGRQVRLGLEAPPEVSIWRGELSHVGQSQATGERQLATIPR
jgi:carbon storage regulator